MKQPLPARRVRRTASAVTGLRVSSSADGRKRARAARHGDPRRERATPVADVARDVTAIVVCHDNRAEVGRCLESVLALGCAVTLVDTASEDESVSFVRDTYPEVSVMALTENTGFGTASNVGIGPSTSRYVLLLNADAWTEPGAVEALVRAAEDGPDVALLGPRLVNPDGSHQRSVFGYPFGPLTFLAFVAVPGLSSQLYRVRQLLRGDDAIVPPTEFISGAALLIRRGASASALSSLSQSPWHSGYSRSTNRGWAPPRGRARWTMPPSRGEGNEGRPLGSPSARIGGLSSRGIGRSLDPGSTILARPPAGRNTATSPRSSPVR